MRQYEISTIWTADRDFRRFPGITTRNPYTGAQPRCQVSADRLSCDGCISRCEADPYAPRMIAPRRGGPEVRRQR